MKFFHQLHKSGGNRVNNSNLIGSRKQEVTQLLEKYQLPYEFFR